MGTNVRNSCNQRHICPVMLFPIVDEHAIDTRRQIRMAKLIMIKLNGFSDAQFRHFRE